LYRRIVKVLDSMRVEYEIVMVDDCDGMGSWEEVKKVAALDNRVKAIHFTKNFGQGRAITAGVANASGKWIVTMDCDLQDSPENIPELYAKANEGYDVVFVRRCNRKESFVVRFFAKVYHDVVSYLSEVPFDYDLGTFLIASRRAAKGFVTSKDRGRDFGMYLMWLSYRYTFLQFDQEQRYEGKTSYTFIKKVKYAMGIITSYSNRLLYIPIFIGALTSVGSLLYIIVVFFYYFVLDANPEGWSTIVASIFLFGGLILSTLGVIGIYIGNIFDMGKERPLFVIQEMMNFEKE
jgi:dolichol-phosphate mannosyltransferase